MKYVVHYSGSVIIEADNPKQAEQEAELLARCYAWTHATPATPSDLIGREDA